MAERVNLRIAWDNAASEGVTVGIRIEPFRPAWIDSTNIILGEVITRSSKSSPITITNIIGSDNTNFANYRITFTGGLKTEYWVHVPTTNCNAEEIGIGPPGSTTGGALGFFLLQGDARYVLRNSGHATNLSITATSTPSPSAGQVLTYGPGGVAAWSNAPAVGGISVAQGTNIALVTNGSVITIHGTSTGGGGSGNMTTSTDGVAITNLIATKQQGAAWLTNISGTGALTNGTTITNFIQAAHDTNAAQTAGMIALTNAVLAAHNTNAAQVAGLISLSNSVSALTNLANTKLDTNSGTGMFNTFYQPLTIDLTNTGTLGVSGDTYLGGDLTTPLIQTFNSVNQLQVGLNVNDITTFLIQGQIGSWQWANDVWRIYGTNNGDSWLFNENIDNGGNGPPHLYWKLNGFTGFQTNNPQAVLHVGNGGSAIVDGAFTSASISYLTGGNARDANGNLYVTNSTGIDAGGGTGEANTASSLGAGTHIFHAKSGVDLQFNTLAASSGLLLSSNNNLISIAADWAQIASKTNATDLTNLANTKQHGSQILTNLSGTGAVTNVVSLSTSNATSRPITNSYTSGVLTLRGIEMGSGLTLSANASNIVPAIDYTQVASFTNATALTNLANQKQQGDAALTNLVGTVARNVTNVVSLSTSNATSRPITNSYTAGVLTLRGLEAGSNVTLSENASNIVFSATGDMTIAVNGTGGTNLANTKQQGDAKLTNLVGVAVVGYTNQFSTNQLWIGAGAFAPTGGSVVNGGRNGATAGSYTNQTTVRDTWDFDDTTNEMAMLSVPLGSSFAGFAVVHLHWMNGGDTNLTTVWEVAFSPHATNEVLTNFLYVTNLTIRSVITNGLNISSTPQYNFTNWPAKRGLWDFRIARLGTNSSDTTVGDARLLGAEISIVTTNYTGGF